VEVVGRLLVLAESQHRVLEGQEDPGIHVQSQLEVERSAAPLLGVQVHLPHLAQRVRLHEVPLIVHVEPVVDRVVLEVGDVAGDIDSCHSAPTLAAPLDTSFRQVSSPPVDHDELLAVLNGAAHAVADALDGLEDWGPSGRRPGQYRCDLAADAAALEVLHGAGLPVLSEESGHTSPRTGGAGGLLAVLDPVDGSTNAAHGIPWYATSICVLDGDGPLAAVVVNQATGAHFQAVRGGGARRDGAVIQPSGRTALPDALVATTGWSNRHLGWAQLRVLGAAALDLCAVASGVLDGFLVTDDSALYGWDYLGGLLICSEAGAVVAERDGADLVVRDDTTRRPVAGATAALMDALRHAAGT